MHRSHFWSVSSRHFPTRVCQQPHTHCNDWPLALVFHLLHDRRSFNATHLLRLRNLLACHLCYGCSHLLRQRSKVRRRGDDRRAQTKVPWHSEHASREDDQTCHAWVPCKSKKTMLFKQKRKKQRGFRMQRPGILAGAWVPDAKAQNLLQRGDNAARGGDLARGLCVGDCKVAKPAAKAEKKDPKRWRWRGAGRVR